MGIIKYFRKKYWEAAIFRGGRRIPFSCDGLTAVPDRAYALFTEKELEKVVKLYTENEEKSQSVRRHQDDYLKQRRQFSGRTVASFEQGRL